MGIVFSAEYWDSDIVSVFYGSEEDAYNILNIEALNAGMRQEFGPNVMLFEEDVFNGLAKYMRVLFDKEHAANMLDYRLAITTDLRFDEDEADAIASVRITVYFPRVNGEKIENALRAARDVVKFLKVVSSAIADKGFPTSNFDNYIAAFERMAENAADFVGHGADVRVVFLIEGMVEIERDELPFDDGHYAVFY